MDPTIYRGSALGMTTNSSLFTLPPTDVSVVSSNFISVSPMASYKDSDGTLCFNVPSSTQQYMDLSSSYLYLKVKVLNKDGSDLTTTNVSDKAEDWLNLMQSDSATTPDVSDKAEDWLDMMQADSATITTNSKNGPDTTTGTSSKNTTEGSGKPEPITDNTKTGSSSTSVMAKALPAKTGTSSYNTKVGPDQTKSVPEKKEEFSNHLKTADLVAPSNLFFYTLFENCRVTINGTVVGDSNGHYAHLSVIPTLLTNGKGEKESEMTSILLYSDTEPDTFDPALNSGFKIRQSLAAGSRVFDMLGAIPINIFQQQKFLPTACAVTVELQPQLRPAFCLDSPKLDKEYKFQIVEAELYIKMLTINPEIVTSHIEHFSRNKAQYPIRNTKLRTSMVPMGSLSYFTMSPVTGKLPTTVVIGLVSQDALNGVLNKSPFNFQGFGLTKISISVDENPASIREIKVDFANQNYLQGYQSLFKALDRGNCEGNSISRSDYAKGNALFLFDLQNSVGSEFHLANSGQLKVSLEFGKATTAQIGLVIFSTYEGLMELDQYRAVYLRN